MCSQGSANGPSRDPNKCSPYHITVHVLSFSNPDKYPTPTVFLISPMRAMCYTCVILGLGPINITVSYLLPGKSYGALAEIVSSLPHFFYLRSKYFPARPVLNIFVCMSFPGTERPSSNPYKTEVQLIPNMSVFTVLHSRRQSKIN